HSDKGDAMQDMQQMHEQMSAGIKAGKIDTTKLDAQFQAMRAVAKAHQEREAKALNDLHAALDATQRKALVAAMRDKQAKREEAMAKHEKGGGAADWGKHELDRLTQKLD